ncbi:MAG TPA: ABC transporter permease, partial [Vicinamibacterales bacterium]
GLTAVSTLGMAVAIAVTAASFAMLYTYTGASLPLDEGDRIVAILQWDSETRNVQRRVVHDFVAWRDSLRSITDIGAYRHVPRNLVEPGVPVETVRVTEMSAAGFRVARVAPLAGRVLRDEDERPDAPPVVVLGYDVWRERFSADPGTLGRAIQLGSEAYTVAGIMPEGFAFPVDDRIWVPFKPDPSRVDRLEGPSLGVFGRLADGATFESAQAEAATLGMRMAAELPATHARLRPRVLPYTYPFFDLNDPASAWVVHLMQSLISMLLVVVCVNVAILIYARTATRQAELAVRAALGASRARIGGQLFTEGLVLAVLASIIGLALAAFGLRQVNLAMERLLPQLPFWWTLGLTPGTVGYVVGLTLLAGSIVGVIPALKATGANAQASLKSISSGGGSGMQLGRLWTFLIVAQVALAMVLLPPMLFNGWDAVSRALIDPGPAAEEHVSADLDLERPEGVPRDEKFAARYAAAHAELERRLESLPGVTGVTSSLVQPGTELAMVIEVQGAATPQDPVSYNIVGGSTEGHLARFNRVDPDFFEIFGVRLLHGRVLGAADSSPGSTSVVVGRTFVEKVLDGGTALGRRFRYVGTSREARAQVGREFEAAAGERGPAPWFEIVGVVEDFPARTGSDRPARIYHPAIRDGLQTWTVTAHIPGGAPAAFASRFRETAAAVDPDLQLRNIATRGQMARREQGLWRVIAAVLGAVMVSVVALVAAGIYAMMSFTVARRRREIGIRAALGADPRRILMGIFSRAFGQLALGALAGLVIVIGVEKIGGGGLMQGTHAVVLPLVAVLLIAVGLAAAAVPARRGLRIQPIEALRDS